MKAIDVFTQQNGETTSAYYKEMNSRGPLGQIAVALFRAQKRSSRAKEYRRGKYRRATYEVKEWSLSEAGRLLAQHGSDLGFIWGWKQDPSVVFDDHPSWVLYVDIPEIGQCSFHAPTRGTGPDYPGEWDGAHRSADVIIKFCDCVGVPVMLEDSK